MKEKKHINRLIGFLLLCVLCAGFLTGCGDAHRAKMIHTTSGYSGPISKLFPMYEVAEHDANTVLYLLRDGGAIEAWDAQNLSGQTRYWIPLTLDTIVIAVDRDQTDMPVASWNDLKGSGVDVCITNYRQLDCMMAAAICYGLEGENFTLDGAVGLLEPLNQSGKLKLDDPAAPIQICFDSAAAVRIKNGENIEIVIPPEGTLSYVKGLLSDEPLDLPDGYEQTLTESGLRLPDGRCDQTLYPPPAQYSPAAPLIPNSTFNSSTSKLHSPKSTLLTHFLITTSGWTRVLHREIRHSRLYASADGLEHILFAAVFLILAVIWIGSITQRSRQKNIRRIILVMAVLIVGWVTARVIKYEVVGEHTLTRFLWYGYYVFQSLLTLCLLRIASLIGAPETVVSDHRSVSGRQGDRFRREQGTWGREQGPKWFLVVCAFNIILVGLVMTNDLHGMMFKLDLSRPGWSDNYAYGFLYYTVAAALLLQIIGGVALMLAKIKHSPRRFGAVLPLIFVAALITYVAGYALRIPFFKERDVALVACTFALLFLELCLQTGMIPVNRHYRDLFKNAAGLNLQITDNSGNSVIASYGAEPLSIGQWSRFYLPCSPIRSEGGGGAGSDALGAPGGFSGQDVVQVDENTLLFRNKIPGGYAVWREDVTLINKLKADIAESNRSLEAANALLSGEALEKERSAQIRTQIECYIAFEKDMAVHERRIASLLESVSGGGAEYTESLKKAAMLTCYIKRRSYFLYLTMEGRKSVSFPELLVYIDELAKLARLSGLQCLSYCNLTGEISLERAMLFYDFWASLLEWAAGNNENDVVLQVINEDGRPTMRVTAGNGAVNYELPKKMARELRLAGGTMAKTEDREVGFAVLRMSFVEEGGKNA